MHVAWIPVGETKKDVVLCAKGSDWSRSFGLQTLQKGGLLCFYIISLGGLGPCLTSP